MTEDIREQLKRWGSAQQAYVAVLMDGHSAGTHQLEQAMSLAPGTRERAERALIGRDGTARRAYMAQAVGIKGMRVVPMWSCDPVPAHNDASPPFDVRAVIEPAIPDELRWIDRALSAMSRRWPVREAIVREEFTGGGTQRMKARRVELKYGGSISIDQYKRELRRGLDYMEGRDFEQAA
jgi:hypothetical protein